MGDEPKLCPLRKQGHTEAGDRGTDHYEEFEPCIGGRCAWWIGCNGFDCAIVALAEIPGVIRESHDGIS